MSAVKDPAQATTFIYSNFYQLYRKSKLEAQDHHETVKGLVLKTHSITKNPGFTTLPTASVAEVRVISPHQMEQLSHWSHAGMSSHLRSLNESRKRLKYLMAEIDDLLKKS